MRSGFRCQSGLNNQYVVPWMEQPVAVIMPKAAVNSSMERVDPMK